MLKMKAFIVLLIISIFKMKNANSTPISDSGKTIEGRSVVALKIFIVNKLNLLTN